MGSGRASSCRAGLAGFRLTCQTANTNPHSRDVNRARVAVQSRPQNKEGARNAGCDVHPQPRVQVKKHTSNSHHRHNAIIRHSLRDGFTGSFVLSPGIGLSCPRHRREYLANLTPASRRQDHTTSPSASGALVKALSASTASRPASVTIAIRPFVGRDGQYIKLIWVGRQAIVLKIVIYFWVAAGGKKPMCWRHFRPFGGNDQASGAGACRENLLGLK
jgi:hypothetical protein